MHHGEHESRLEIVACGLLDDDVGNREDVLRRQTAASRVAREMGANLRELAVHLQQVEAATGRRIVVAIEPEPGCALDTTADLVAWFDQHLPEKTHREYITVCHDICHAAVMMERQADVIEQLRVAGITIGKVQVSSAIVAYRELRTSHGSVGT